MEPLLYERSPLRFGVFCPAAGLSSFAHQCIRSITRDGLATVVLLIVDKSQELPSPLRVKVRKSLRLDGNLWHLQSRLFPPTHIPAYAVGPLPGEVPRITCTPERKGKWSQYFTAADVETIKAHDLDFILKFAFGIIRGPILQAARHGVWSYHHDDENNYRGSPPAFWEIYKGDAVTGALLQRLTDRLDGGVVLKKCYVATDGLSYRRNLQRIQESSWHMVRWVCLDLMSNQADYLDSPPSKTNAPIYKAPGDFQMLWFWARLLFNWFLFKLANQRIDEWNIGIVRKPQAAFLHAASQPPVEWSAYREPGQMVADPFLVPTQGFPRVLVEELNWTSEKGRISELRWPDSAAATATVTPLIDEGLHMSYPFVFEHEGAVYAIPECAEANAVLLYRLDPESGTWSRESTLIENVDALDSTVFRVGDTWWLMHSSREGCGPWSLYLWYAPSLLGPWEPHLANPVKTDVGGTRPAGNPFFHEGILYRPAQDGRKSYGGALCINRVDELSRTTFRETVVRRIFPDPVGPYPDGIHTLSGFGDWCVVDGKKHRWPPGFILRRFVAKRLHSTPRGFAYASTRLAGPVPVPDLSPYETSAATVPSNESN